MREYRSYQKTAANKGCLEWKTPGIYRILIVAPTGAGKTVMAMAIVEKARKAGVKRILMVVHRDELKRQVQQYDSDLIVESIQTLVSRETFPDVGLVIVDEAHHYAADKWSRIFDAYPSTRMLGLTATPARADGRGLGGPGRWQRLIVAAQYPELLEAGYLVNCKVIRPEVYQGSNLGKDPVEAYLEHTPGQRGFVYTRYVADAERLKERFGLKGVTAEVIDGDLALDERAKRIERFKAGETTLLINVHCLTEGVDVPAASVCLLARGCSHSSTYLQMVGRVLRPHPSKKNATLIDLPGVSHIHGMPLDARDYSLESGIKRASGGSGGVKQCPSCGSAFHPAIMRCDNCGFKFSVEPRWKPKVYSLELEERWAGDATPGDVKHREYKRLRKLARAKGWSIGWVVKCYKKLFGTAPCLDDVTEDERMDELGRLLKLARKKGNKPGWAMYLFRETFGSWPTR